ncbi:Spx/MgsR family RNA polymerase-binding regulatory protein [Limnohabitans sp. DM1]|uniref:Spx/MgsR family RNA polymerase-binding regulatory protein n=1 Tax=Limnohabitans sp. DM1 TaxID=1597955 RepID=UPI000B1FC8DD|nr:Spx/MgsR family RNA polymerase-binding regulatory protein [Limnohabitans sp. DM1]
MELTVYGIPNCDSVKKARTWLTDHGLSYTFHDFKKQGVPAAELAAWVAAAGWETVLNRKGTTWRKLDASVQSGVTDSTSAQQVMQEHASTIKRPVIAWPSGRVTVGHVPDQWPA